MNELGIFIDESGTFDVAEKDKNNLRDLYIVSFVFHNKSNNIHDEVIAFEQYLFNMGLTKNLPVHTMPLIRQQKPYKYMICDTRRKIFYKLFQFMRKLKLPYKVFVYDKKYSDDKQAIKNNLEQYIEQLILENFEYFKKFDEIVIYYDEGQEALSKVLHNSFSKNLNNLRFKDGICQSDYRLLQCADMVCSLELITQRKSKHEYIKAIDKFFGSGNLFNKNYAKRYREMEFCS